MNYFLIEIKKFLKNNTLKLLIGTLIVSLIIAGGMYFLNQRTQNQKDDLENEIGEDRVEVDAAPVTFQLYVENPDGDTYINNSIIEEMLTTPEVLEDISSETSTNLDEIVERTRNGSLAIDDNIEQETESSKIIGVIKDASSHTLTFYINVRNEIDNLKIGEYLYDYIDEGNFSLFSGKTVYTLQEPEPIDINNQSDNMEVISATGDMEVDEYNAISSIIISIILGFTVTLGLLLVNSFFSKNLKYYFTYTVKNNDIFLLVDNNINYKNELINLFNNNSVNSNVVIKQDYNPSTEQEYDGFINGLIEESSANVYADFFEVNNLDKVNRVIYIINENITTREWYNKQRRFDKTHSIPTVVIQINQ